MGTPKHRWGHPHNDRTQRSNEIERCEIVLRNSQRVFSSRSVSRIHRGSDDRRQTCAIPTHRFLGQPDHREIWKVVTTSGRTGRLVEFSACTSAPCNQRRLRRAHKASSFDSGPMAWKNRASILPVAFSHCAGSTARRSSIGGRSLGMDPRLPSATARPVQSTNSR
jgi:hypothetical protein